eukprot:161456-Prymnesium_polylepis.1
MEQFEYSSREFSLLCAGRWSEMDHLKHVLLALFGQDGGVEFSTAYSLQLYHHSWNMDPMKPTMARAALSLNLRSHHLTLLLLGHHHLLHHALRLLVISSSTPSSPGGPDVPAHRPPQTPYTP